MSCGAISVAVITFFVGVCQPVGQFSVACMFQNVLPDQFAYDLRYRQVLLGADFLKNLFFSGVDEKGHSRGAIFHRVNKLVCDDNHVIILFIPNVCFVFVW